jgi:hypothetical protein
MQPAVIEWNELTSQRKIDYGDLLLIIFWTHPMFPGVHGKTDQILNVTDHRALKKAHGIGGSWRITEESVLNSLSALSIRTAVAQLFQTAEVRFSEDSSAGGRPGRTESKQVSGCFS